MKGVSPMNKGDSKSYRILDLYRRLFEGQTINKSEASILYNVDGRSIQRDIDDIRAFFADQKQIGDSREILYDQRKKGFTLSGNVSPIMTSGEILAVSKILLDSRAFTKDEMFLILDKLLVGCVPQQNMKIVSDLLSNEKFHYVELTNPQGIQDKIWTLGNGIYQHSLMDMSYQRQDSSKPPVERIVEPVSIMFSDYYFYLNAYIVEADESGAYHHKYDYPAIFRVDRIMNYSLRHEKFSLPYADRFQEGEFRKRVQFMFSGRLQQITFRYTGLNVSAILDRLPTARVIEQQERGYTIQAEVYGNGIVMWLLSQGERVEVLSPTSLRNEIRETLRKMLDIYE